MQRVDSLEKTLMLGGTRGQEEKGTTEDEMAGWHHWLDGREFGWTPGDGDGQGGLACCDSWGHKESDTAEWLNWTELWSMWLDWLVFCDGGFQSVCPLMEKDKRLMKASWWDRLTEGDTESPLLFYNTFSLKKKQTNKKLCYLICQGSDNQKIPQIFMLGTCLRILLSSSFTCSF